MAVCIIVVIMLAILIPSLLCIPESNGTSALCGIPICAGLVLWLIIANINKSEPNVKQEECTVITLPGGTQVIESETGYVKNVNEEFKRSFKDGDIIIREITEGQYSGGLWFDGSTTYKIKEVSKKGIRF
jgi:hypothetical protein